MFSFAGHGAPHAPAGASAAAGAPKMPTLASLTGAVTGVDPEQAAWEAQCSLTRRQRLIGFAVCFGAGMLISLLSTLQLWALKLVSFAILYSLGNLVSFASTGFLVGPRAQCRMACDKSRAAATTIFLVTMVATLLTAILYKDKGATALCIVLIILQFCALVWYSAVSVARSSADDAGRVVRLRRGAHTHSGRRTSLTATRRIPPHPRPLVCAFP